MHLVQIQKVTAFSIGLDQAPKGIRTQAVAVDVEVAAEEAVVATKPKAMTQGSFFIGLIYFFITFLKSFIVKNLEVFTPQC